MADNHGYTSTARIRLLNEFEIEKHTAGKFGEPLPLSLGLAQHFDDGSR